MTVKSIKIFISSALLLMAPVVDAQQLVRDEYRAEIGVTGGVGNYLGEANASLLKYFQPVVGGIFRYKVNQRIAFRAELTTTNVAGDGITKNNIYTGDLCGEFNFFDLEQNPFKRFSKTYSPYIFTGLCLMTDVYHAQTLPVAGIPFGMGLKVKIASRLNLNIQWTSRLMLVDNLEGTTSPGITDIYNNNKQLNGSNIFNNDMTSAFTVGITLDIWKRACNCLNSSYR